MPLWPSLPLGLQQEEGRGFAGIARAAGVVAAEVVALGLSGFGDVLAAGFLHSTLVKWSQCLAVLALGEALMWCCSMGL